MLDHIEFLQKVFFGNTLAAYLGAVIFFAGAFLVLYLVNQFILTRMKRFAEKTETRLDDFFIEIFKKMILPLLYVGAVYFALQQLVLSASVARAVTVIAIAAVVFQVTRLITVLLVHLVRYFWIKSPEGAPGTGNTIISILKVIVWGIAAVFLLDNMGFNISAVVAGLGIGGVAIALAAQTILGDLFNYFVIFFDKPFEEGDFVIVDEYLGVIEHVGIKTTRIRSLDRKSTRLNSSHLTQSRMPSSA